MTVEILVSSHFWAMKRSVDTKIYQTKYLVDNIAAA